MTDIAKARRTGVSKDIMRKMIQSGIPPSGLPTAGNSSENIQYAGYVEIQLRFPIMMTPSSKPTENPNTLISLGRFPFATLITMASITAGTVVQYAGSFGHDQKENDAMSVVSLMTEDALNRKRQQELKVETEQLERLTELFTQKKSSTKKQESG
jgi:hypothetical protein